jgi:hypothetical protein
METNTFKVEHKENSFILDIILKYKLYQEFKIEPVFITMSDWYGSVYNFKSGYKPFEVTARISKDDFDKVQIGNFLSDINIERLNIPHKCYIGSTSMNINYPYSNHYEITLYFFT